MNSHVKKIVLLSMVVVGFSYGAEEEQKEVGSSIRARLGSLFNQFRSPFEKAFTTYSEPNLYEAAFNGNILHVQTLLQDPQVDVNVRGGHAGQSPLGVACYKGHSVVVAALMNDNRTDFNQRDYHGRTPLFLSCCNSSTSTYLIHLLFFKKDDIDVNLGNIDGHTPLMVVSELGDRDALKKLLEHPKININQIVRGETALDRAKDEDTIRELNKNGAVKRHDLLRLQPNTAAPSISLKDVSTQTSDPRGEISSEEGR